MSSPEWLKKLEQFCYKYNIEIEFLSEILNDPKVIPMIRGKGFEFTAKKFLSRLLSSQHYEVTNPRLNTQSGSKDIDVEIKDKIAKINYSVECKLASKGSFRWKKGEPPFIKVKCMRSRTLGDIAAKQKSDSTGINYELLKLHNDQYVSDDFDFVITSIANAFYETNQDGLFYWSPSDIAQPFLDKISVKTQNDAFYKLYIAKSENLSVNGQNRTGGKIIECHKKRKKSVVYKKSEHKDNYIRCEDILHKIGERYCNFIPNYPKIYFNPDTGKPYPPWFEVENLENLPS